MEVCSLSRGMMLLLRNPYLPHYKAAFAFSIFLCPPFYQPASQLAFPEGERRDYHVLHEYHRMG
jgi:hypothetical protein